MITYSPGSPVIPARSSAALMAMPPSSGAVKPLSEPSRRPTPVRAPPVITASRIPTSAGWPQLADLSSLAGPAARWSFLPRYRCVSVSPGKLLARSRGLRPGQLRSVADRPAAHGPKSAQTACHSPASGCCDTQGRALLRRWRSQEVKAQLLTRIDHVGIVCHDLDEKVAFYESLFELTVTSREINEEQGVREAMLRVADGPAGSSWIQLLAPLAADTPVGRFLARRGEGIHHIGYGVNSITQALASIGAAGVRLLDTRPRHGSTGASIAFIHPADVGGVLTELVELTPSRA